MFGLILIICAQIAYAFGGVLIRKYLSSYNPLLVSSLMAVISGLIFLPILFIGFRNIIGNFTFKNIWPFIITALVWLVVAEFLYIYGFQKAPSLTLASLMTLFYPLFSAILGIIFFHEAFTWKTIIAGILMTGGFVLSAI
ncbi:MAG: DMT family transporter [Candidatus Shapirobacteria bacterium]|jgi:drug/metabolite transporter (DMT)-like permease